jgi:hypothetical protein
VLRILRMLTSYEGIAILQPGIVLPAQLVQQPTNFRPEHRLMLAVLEDAVSCLQRFAQPRGRQQRRAFDGVRRWLLSAAAAWPFSCTNICSALGIDVSYLRRGLAPWLRDGGTAAPPVTAYQARRCSGSRTRATPLCTRERPQATCAVH